MTGSLVKSCASGFIAAMFLLLGVNTAVFAQPTIRLPETPTTTNFQGAANAPALTPIPPVGAPPTAAPAFNGGVNGGATLGQPQFDPFSSNPQYAAPPALLQSPPGSPLAPNTYPYGTNPQATPSLGQPFVGQPGQGSPQFGPAPGYPQSPPVAYPYGASQGSQGWGPAGSFSQPTAGPYMRFFQNVSLHNTFLYGGSGRELGINEFGVAATMNYPNFLYSGQPLQVTPGFDLAFLSGPETNPAEGITADMPARLYSVYLDLAAITDTSKLLGAEANFTVGAYSDFNTVTADSFRYTGTGLGWYRVSPTVVLKGGVTYLDRNDIKILPAVGLFWTPNPDVNIELYFPSPKASQRVMTLGNTDVWAYLGAEYGGGSWTIDRADGSSDQVDINDIRVFIGGETKGENALVRGFGEIGYVFDRELFYKRMPSDNQKLKDTFMLRGGARY